MKITKFFLMAALALTFAACSNDDNDIQNPAPQPAKAEGITITATLAPKSGGADTRALTPGDNKIVASWAVGEKIAILYEKGGTNYEADAEIMSMAIAEVRKRCSHHRVQRREWYGRRHRLQVDLSLNSRQ